jgi:aminoglycoside phosphotransferase (APT) family kinase protein
MATMAATEPTGPDREDGIGAVDELTDRLMPEPALRDWVGDRLPGTGPFVVRRGTSGHSNEIFSIERDGQRWLARRPPRVANAPGAHGMAREFRVLQALQGSDVAHAQGRLLCEDLEVIGVPFYIMDWVDGIRLYDGIPPALDGVDARLRVAEELFDALAELHNLDWQAAGLEGFGKPDTFTQRQVSRWLGQLASYQTRELPDLTEAGAWLEAHIPTTQRPALIHGDYGLHNVLYRPESPLDLVAVVDWETATVGDPLIDLGYLLGLWLEGDEPQRWTASALPYDIAGFPPRAPLAERYAQRTGLDLSTIDWYRAVAQLKVACILEGGYARFLRGDTDDPEMERLGERVPNHAAYALAITRGEA